MAIEQKIIQLIEPVLKDRGYDLVRLLFQKTDSNPVLQIMVEHSDYSEMKAGDCETLSKALSAILDVEDLISGRYVLEITSPGIDRPLVKIEDYERFKGRDAKIETILPIDGRKRFKGKLIGTSGSEVHIDFEGTDTAIEFSTINKAKLILTDELVAQLLKKESK